MPFVIAAAAKGDEGGIRAVLAANRGDRFLFQRSQYNIAAHIGDFAVARDRDGSVLGCAALHEYSRRLAEILSVAVLPELHGHGIGAALVKECERRAAERGIGRVFLATAKPDYFARLGYRRIAMWSLPARVLLEKLRPVFQQEGSRWWPALAGRYTFMERRVATP